MVVSTVTISIEEFEHLISCKCKIEKIKQLKEDNLKQFRETNKLFDDAFAKGDKKSCDAIIARQDLRNLHYMDKISRVLKGE